MKRTYIVCILKHGCFPHSQRETELSVPAIEIEFRFYPHMRSVITFMSFKNVHNWPTNITWFQDFKFVLISLATNEGTHYLPWLIEKASTGEVEKVMFNFNFLKDAALLLKTSHRKSKSTSGVQRQSVWRGWDGPSGHSSVRSKLYVMRKQTGERFTT